MTTPYQSYPNLECVASCFHNCYVIAINIPLPKKKESHKSLFGENPICRVLKVHVSDKANVTRQTQFQDLQGATLRLMEHI